MRYPGVVAGPEAVDVGILEQGFIYRSFLHVKIGGCDAEPSRFRAIVEPVISPPSPPEAGPWPQGLLVACS